MKIQQPIIWPKPFATAAENDRLERLAAGKSRPFYDGRHVPAAIEPDEHGEDADFGIDAFGGRLSW